MKKLLKLKISTLSKDFPGFSPKTKYLRIIIVRRGFTPLGDRKNLYNILTSKH